MCPTAPSRSFGDWNQPHITRRKQDSQSKARMNFHTAKACFQNRLIYRDRVVLRCWVFSNTFCWASLQLASCEPMDDDMKRDFAVGGDSAAAQAWRWFSVLRSFHHDGTSPSARRKRQLGEACCGVLDGVMPTRWLRLAAARPALWTCRLRASGMSFRRALCGAAKKTVTMTSMNGWSCCGGPECGGKAFLAHNMVLCDDDQWTCELVGFPAQGLSNDTFSFVLDVCATLWRLSMHPWARSPG